ncbi:SDR family oxidoreductase [Granulicella cerasi]|uniref:SDR family oxidoreductase n=1 Tax=Granulicella cerasi TaxID=741063 RepID=A0ABW1ZBC1_9BACT|nr:SDR family oxidoreductase [Granulicella cerasi]
MAKVVLITGANKGIGFEVARQLSKAGFTVLLGARDAARGEEAASKLRAEGGDVRYVAADLNNAAASSAALAKSITEEFGHLDVLVNNAGVFQAGDGHASDVSLDILRSTFEVNFFGTVAFTQPFVPLLRAAGKAKVINVSSGLGSIGINTDPNTPYYDTKVLAYNTSKAALNMFTADLAYDFRDTDVTVNSVCPGYTATDLNGHSGHQTIEEGAIAIVRLATSDDAPTATFIHKDGNYPW